MQLALRQARAAAAAGEVPVGCVVVCAGDPIAQTGNRTDPKAGAVENGVRYFSAPTCLHRPEIYGGIGAGEAAELLQSFFRARRG